MTSPPATTDPARKKLLRSKVLYIIHGAIFLVQVVPLLNMPREVETGAEFLFMAAAFSMIFAGSGALAVALLLWLTRRMSPLRRFVITMGGWGIGPIIAITVVTGSVPFFG